MKELIELIKNECQRELSEEPFHVLDLGCSGGIDSNWWSLEPFLVALGIDFNIREIERLNDTEKNTNIKYFAGNLELPPDHPVRKERGTPFVCESHKAFTKTSAWDAYCRRKKEHDSLENLSKPDYVNFEKVLREHDFRYVDFIKIDVDGPDFDILQALEPSLGRLQVLGLKLEVNFNGSSDPHDHTFHNMDRLMRKNGFDLYDLEVRRYTKSALLGPFACDFFGQTINGSATQGDAVYFLNPIPANYSSLKIVKLITLLTLQNQIDSAAELIKDLENKSSLKQSYLEKASQIHGFPNYKNLMETWEKSPESFLKIS
jgi:hypothetical protein